MALPVEILCVPAGGSGFSLTDRLDGSPQFATAAVGGFADATFTLHGDARKLIPSLALIRIMYGDWILYEGQVEDVDPSGSADSLVSTVTCFGLRNLLTENSVRRIWSKRDISWTDMPGATVPVSGWTFVRQSLDEFAGSFDPTDLTKKGIQIRGTGVAISPGQGRYAWFLLPTGVTIQRILGTVDFVAPAGMAAKIWTDAGDVATITASGAVSAAAASAARVGFGLVNPSGGALTPTSAQYAALYDVRLLGTSLAEDASGGFYGGTILRDLISLVPGLAVGTIEDGSDFTIQAIERAVRDQALSVVQEVAGYYTREWAVWEGGRFDWKTRALDQDDWIISVADASSLSIKSTLDGLSRTVYVLYTDAASGIDAEASSTSTAQRNPYVKQSRARDLIVNAGFPMTSNTSAQLAARIAADSGNWIPVTGTVTVPATTTIYRANGASLPAALIRSGDNLTINDLPKTDIFAQGRDGETLFHIVGTSCDLKAGTITLELEGQSTRTDVLLARLAAVTRTLTG